MTAPSSRRGVSQETPLRELLNRRRDPVSRFFIERPTARTVIVVGFAALIALLGWVSSATRPEPVNPWLVGALVAGQVISIASLVWRNSRPLTVFVIVLVMDILSSLALVFFLPITFETGTVAGIVTMYSVAKWKRPAVTWTAGAVSWVFTVVFLAYYIRSDEVMGEGLSFWGFFLGSSAALAAFYLAVIVVGLSVRRDRLHQQDLEAWSAARSANAQLEERARIARELHDVVAHSLTVMIALADGAKVVTRRDPERGSEVMAEVSATGRAALADMRRVLGVLKSAGDDDAPLSPMPAADRLRELILGFKTAGLPVRLIQEGGRLPENPAFTQTIYRIVQESLTNALRYARSASEVTVTIGVDDSGIRLRIADNGHGTSADAKAPFIGTGNGLAGLTARAEAFGGTLTVGPQPSQGWAVDVRFPPQQNHNPSAASAATPE